MATADGRPRKPRRSADPEPLGAVLGQMSREPVLAAGLALGRLGRRWPEVVGERLAAESAPYRLNGGVLLVRVTSAPWAAQVVFLAKDVARRANEVLPEGPVREVRVVLHPP